MEILNPVQLESTSGLSFTFRPLTAADAAPLGEYFISLSPQTVDLYGPHPFDQETADRLCAEMDPARIVRWIALLPVDGREQVVGYLIQHLGIPDDEMRRYSQAGYELTPAAGCLVAPSIADAYQNRGLGSPMMAHVLKVARRMGFQYALLEGGVFAHNERAVHFYEKHGFQRAGTFVASWAKGRPSYDMIYYLDGERG
jgi:diamine N-acetyltransferase